MQGSSGTGQADTGTGHRGYRGYRVGVTKGAGYRVGGTGAHMGCRAGGLFYGLKN